MKTKNQFTNKLSNSITLKIGIIGFLILIMLIPTSWINSIIIERQLNRDFVINEIHDKWGNEQIISGPILTIPWFEYQDYEKDGEKKTQQIYKTLHVLPENLLINGSINPEIRSRGTYKVIVYQSSLVIEGQIQLPDFNDLKINPENILWDEAFLSIGIPDMRGIQNNISIKWNNENLSVDPGINIPEIANSGFTTKAPLNAGVVNYDFNFNLNLNGSGNLFFTPTGKTTEINLSSTWANPKFTGDFLPDYRSVTEEGFEASWNVLQLNRNFPQIWKNKIYNIGNSAFGVELLFPLDEYQKSMRSIKYAIMFIALTFIIFLFVEILNKKKIHPIQYVLVGTALLIFYTLLLSLSEQLGFNLAYLISSFSIISMISLYAQSIFKKAILSIGMGFVLILLYTFLFFVLQLQDYALLFGSIGLFIILGIIMYFSRKINWYSKSDEEPSSQTELE